MLAFAIFLGLAAAHVCLLNPMQRGGVNSSDLNTVGAPACFQLNGPCGASNGSHPNVEIRPHNYWVVWQKNQDHWFPSAPGLFAIDVALKLDPVEADFKNLATVPDTATPSGYVYSQKVLFPIRNKPTDATVRVRYVTNNPNAPPVFYMCSSVSIY